MKRPPEKPTICLIDPQPFSHSAGYWKAALEIPQKELPVTVVVLAAVDEQSNPETIEILREAECKGFIVHILTLDSQMSVKRYVHLARAFQILRWAERIASKYHPVATSFLYLDSVAPWLLSPFAKIAFPTLSRQMSGIFFHAKCFREGVSSWKKLPVWLWDRFFIRQAIRSKRFNRLSLLDHDLIATLQNIFPGNKCKIQPGVDPWTPFEHISKSSAEIQLGLNPSPRFTVLTLGFQFPRKGTDWLCQALLQPNIQPSDWRLIVAGPIPESFSNELLPLFERLKNAGFEIVIVDRFVTDDESWLFFQVCDVVACPYIGFTGSSNVAIRACAAGKPVVASSGGVIEFAIRNFGAGLLIEDASPAALAFSLNSVKLKLDSNPLAFAEACLRYSEFHSSASFRNQCFNGSLS